MKLTIKKIEEMILKELDEATNQQKTQQRKDNWVLRDKHRKLAKDAAKEIQAQNNSEDDGGEEEEIFKREKSDIDPFEIIKKAFAKDKNIRMFQNGKEVED